MFRLDEERVVDATLCGGLARYINHSCNPNCVAETVEVDRDYRIIIFAKRRIQRGEEVSLEFFNGNLGGYFMQSIWTPKHPVLKIAAYRKNKESRLVSLRVILVDVTSGIEA